MKSVVLDVIFNFGSFCRLSVTVKEDESLDKAIKRRNPDIEWYYDHKNELWKKVNING